MRTVGHITFLITTYGDLICDTGIISASNKGYKYNPQNPLSSRSQKIKCYTNNIKCCDCDCGISIICVANASHSTFATVANRIFILGKALR